MLVVSPPPVPSRSCLPKYVSRVPACRGVSPPLPVHESGNDAEAGIAAALDVLGRLDGD
jgi:hypothetical protein